jgi:TIR domain
MSDSGNLSKSYFLSYSRADETVAMRFATDLRERGIPMWVDQLDIRPSEHWDRAIERAVHECRGLVVILSPRSVESDNVADEISFAIDHKKSVLPVMIERCRLPLRITRMQVIDAIASYERALEQCVDVLSGVAPLRARADAGPAKSIDDAEAIATAKSRLTDIVGPIAGLLVDKAAARAGSVCELYALLGEHIASQSDREHFVALAGKPAERQSEMRVTAPPRNAGQSSVPQEETDRLGAMLTPFLGPMSAAVVRRESAEAASPDELQQRLANLIPNDRERAEFLRQVRA